MASTTKTSWDDLVGKQDVKDVLGDLVNINDVFKDGEFPLTKQIFSHVIKIKADGKDAIHAALFFEYVLMVLTDDSFLDFYRFDDDWVWNKKDIVFTTMIKTSGFPEIKKDQPDMMTAIKTLHKREKAKVSALGEPRKKVESYENLLRDEHVKRVDRNSNKLNEVQKTIFQRLTEAEAEINNKIGPTMQRESTAIDTAQKTFRDKLFKIQLQGALRRNPAREGEPIISPSGISTYQELIEAVNNALQESKCSYLVGIYNSMQKQNIFSIERSRFEKKETDNKLSTLEEMYDKDNKDEKLPDTDYCRRYSSIACAEHEGQICILINKQISDSLPFVCGQKRKEFKLSLLQTRFRDITEKKLRDKGYTKPDETRFATSEARVNEIVCHTIHDTLNLFELGILIKARNMNMGIDKYVELDKYALVSPVKKPLFGAFDRVVDTFNMKVGSVGRADIPIRQNYANLVRLSRLISDKYEKDMFDKTWEYFHEGVSKEAIQFDAKHKNTIVGTANKKLKIITIIFFVVNKILEEEAKKANVKKILYDENIVMSMQEIPFDIFVQASFLPNLINESFFIDAAFPEITGHIETLKKSTKLLRDEIKITWKIWKKDEENLFKIQKEKVSFFDLQHLSDDDSRSRRHIKKIMERQTLQTQSIQGKLKTVRENMETLGIKSNFFDLYSKIQFKSIYLLKNPVSKIERILYDEDDVQDKQDLLAEGEEPQIVEEPGRREGQDGHGMHEDQDAHRRHSSAKSETKTSFFSRLGAFFDDGTMYRIYYSIMIFLLIMGIICIVLVVL